MPVAVQVRVDRQSTGVVEAHREPYRVAAGDVAVLRPAMELVLLLVEAMHDVAGAAAGGAAPIHPSVGVRGRELLAELGTGGVVRVDDGVDLERCVRVAARRGGEVNVVLGE